MSIIFLVLILGPTAVTAVLQIVTNGISGPQCGRAKCLGGGHAVCVLNRCVCLAPKSKGIGNLVCVRPDQNFAAIFNDPVLIGFDRSRTEIPLVSKFLAAHIGTALCAGGTNVVTANGTCDFKLYVWGSRRLGKTFCRGIEAQIMIWVGSTSYYQATRIEVEAVNGTYTFLESGTTEPFAAGAFGDPVTTVIPSVGSVQTFYDDQDNFARVVAEPCGIEIGIRGVERIGDPLVQPAGAYITVENGCAPVYLSNDNSVLSPPTGEGSSLQEQAEVLTERLGQPVTSTLVAVFKAFPGPHMQNFPNAPPEIGTLADIIQECQMATVYRALTLCVFIIQIPKFFRCFDATDKGGPALGLMGECIFCICDKNPLMCSDVQQRVLTSTCSQKIKRRRVSILDFNCNSLGH